MRRPAATLAVVGALAAGALAGAYGSRLLLGQLAMQNVGQTGWTVMAADPTGPRILTRALHVLRDPAGFPDGTIRIFTTTADDDGRALQGGSTYVLRFPAGDMPPADAFWGLSTLDANGRLPASDAPLSVSNGAADVHRSADGAIEVLVQAAPPDDPNANWLPAPTGAFQLVFRLYAPTPGTRGHWRPHLPVRQENGGVSGSSGGLSVLCGGIFALSALAGAVASMAAIPGDTTDDLRHRLTTCAMPGLGCAPVGVFLHQRAVDAPLDAAFGQPDPDTLLSSAWLDLSRGPVKVTIPATGTRFFALQVLNDRGDRSALVTAATAGPDGTTLRVAGPADATGAPTAIEPGTEHAWVVVRFAAHGETDVPAVRALQDALRATREDNR